MPNNGRFSSDHFPLGNAVNIGIWSTIEPGAGIIAGCLATLRPFLKLFLITAKTIRSSTSQSVKQISRSFRSNEDSLNQRSNGGGNAINSESNMIHPGSNIGMYRWHSGTFELKSDVRKTGESTDNILTCTQTQDIDGPRPSKQETDVELHRKNSQTLPTTSLPGTNLDRPLPPLPNSTTYMGKEEF